MSSKKEVQTKYRRNKVKTIPGLSLSNRDLRERVKNRSIVVDDRGQVYTSDPNISRAARQSTVENARDYLKDVGSVTDLQNKISKSRIEMSLANARAEGAKAAQKEVSNG